MGKNQDMKPDDLVKEEEEGYKEKGPEGENARKRGGMMKKRARGGGMKVDGKKAHHRPDKRARGGGVTADMHPETTAGKMTKMPYENKEAKGGTEGAGADKA